MALSSPRRGRTPQTQSRHDLTVDPKSLQPTPCHSREPQLVRRGAASCALSRRRRDSSCATAVHACRVERRNPITVIPAKAGIQAWSPTACCGIVVASNDETLPPSSQQYTSQFPSREGCLERAKNERDQGGVCHPRTQPPRKPQCLVGQVSLPKSRNLKKYSPGDLPIFLTP